MGATSSYYQNQSPGEQRCNDAPKMSPLKDSGLSTWATINQRESGICLDRQAHLLHGSPSPRIALPFLILPEWPEVTCRGHVGREPSVGPVTDLIQVKNLIAVSADQERLGVQLRVGHERIKGYRRDSALLLRTATAMALPSWPRTGATAAS